MDTTKVVEFLPPKARQGIYVGLIIASLLLTATGAVYAVSPYAVPWWVAGGLAGLGVLGAPFGVLAASNTAVATTTMTVGGQPQEAHVVSETVSYETNDSTDQEPYTGARGR